MTRLWFGARASPWWQVALAGACCLGMLWVAGISLRLAGRPPAVSRPQAAAPKTATPAAFRQPDEPLPRVAARPANTPKHPAVPARRQATPAGLICRAGEPLPAAGPLDTVLPVDPSLVDLPALEKPPVPAGLICRAGEPAAAGPLDAVLTVDANLVDLPALDPAAAPRLRIDLAGLRRRAAGAASNWLAQAQAHGLALAVRARAALVLHLRSAALAAAEARPVELAVADPALATGELATTPVVFLEGPEGADEDKKPEVIRRPPELDEPKKEKPETIRRPPELDEPQTPKKEKPEPIRPPVETVPEQPERLRMPPECEPDEFPSPCPPRVLYPRIVLSCPLGCVPVCRTVLVIPRPCPIIVLPACAGTPIGPSSPCCSSPPLSSVPTGRVIRSCSPAFGTPVPHNPIVGSRYLGNPIPAGLPRR